MKDDNATNNLSHIILLKLYKEDHSDYLHLSEEQKDKGHRIFFTNCIKLPGWSRIIHFRNLILDLWSLLSISSLVQQGMAFEMRQLACIVQKLSNILLG